MEDWKERLKAEYAQTKERYEKLKAYNTKRFIERRISVCCDSDAAVRMKEEYRDELMNEQQHIIGDYLHILELRAVLEGIEL